MDVDCHAHIVYGVDDGAKTLEESLMMARIAVAEGTTRMFATPHGFTDSYHVDPNVTREKTIKLNEALKRENIPLEILPAMEIHHAIKTSDKATDDLTRLRSGQAIGYGAADQPRAILLEFSFYEWPMDAAITLRALRDEGIQVVLAHPERYIALRTSPELLDEALAEGVYTQLTTGSILGRFGAHAEELSKRWLKEGKAHIIASDAHSTTLRPPGLREAFMRVREEWNFKEQADRCAENAQLIWELAKI
ncbi:tyrosine-protein phosphatase [Ferroacidibacillus organovorans]|uniref:Tyrosine-protein phosphatase n=1 Tax=Ferroacidibacillus organovorans TaxID=1765683 RepID=A0A853KEA8_9BACL|nr:CpsB/CapC family capsule biosynthesis tyrosine phosphatase [Ferroacidibacillus organovorans]KYP79499.1 hypothetical protein AYJ22_04340 [Ferroacidibacillus organovorans]OAG94549.1 hypothetical protein AYW79_05065 [Ferroacidibacillus organovorans]